VEETLEPVLTASRLRENIYSILDGVLETGVPVEIVRNGRRLRIVADDANPPSKLARLKQRDVIVGDPDDLVHLEWSAEWSELLPEVMKPAAAAKSGAKAMTAGSKR
jgi:hypothetical protein